MRTQLTMGALLFVVGLLLGIVLEAKFFASPQEPNRAGSLSAQPVGAPARSTAAIEKLPHLTVSDAEYNFGSRERGEIVRHTFVLRNAGGSPLRLGDIKPACGCTAADPSRSVIPPGEEAMLDVTLNLAKQKGHQHKAIAVESNDPDQPVFELTMVGEATSRIAMTPKRVEMGGVLASKPTEKVVEVKATDGLSVNVQQVKTSGANISAEYEVIEPGKAYRVHIKLRPMVSEGLVRGWVQLITDHSGEYRVIGIPVSARVESRAGSAASQASAGG